MITSFLFCILLLYRGIFMEEVELNCLLSHILRSRGVSLRENANNHITLQPNKIIAEKIIKREKWFY